MEEEEEEEDKTNRNTRLVDGPYVHTTIWLRLYVSSSIPTHRPLSMASSGNRVLKEPTAES